MNSVPVSSASNMSMLAFLIIGLLVLIGLAITVGLVVLIVCLARRKKNAPKVKEEDVVFVE